MNLLFVTREGIDNPGARLRCYGWAGFLKEKYKVNAEVFSFVDRLNARAGINEEGFSYFEKIGILGKSFFSLLGLSGHNTCFVINRVNYHSLSVKVISMLRKARFILDVDDWESDLPKYRTAAVKLLQKLARESLFCLSGSKFLQLYLKVYNPRSYYLPTGIDMSLFNRNNMGSNVKKNGKVILSWHGTVNRRENVQEIFFLLDIFSLLQQAKVKNIELRIIAGGFFRKEVEEEIKRRRIKNVFLDKWVRWNNVPLYLDRIDIGVVPLEQSIYNASKSPTKIFEYMAAGKAVVASCVGEAKEIIRDNIDGILCKSKEDFVCQIESIIKDRKKREDLGRNARIRVKEKYSLETIVNQLYNIMYENGVVN